MAYQLNPQTSCRHGCSRPIPGVAGHFARTQERSFEITSYRLHCVYAHRSSIRMLILKTDIWRQGSAGDG